MNTEAINNNKMKLQEIKNDIIASWNEVEESITSLKELGDKDLLLNRQAIINRLENTLHWLGKYVDENDVIQEI